MTSSVGGRVSLAAGANLLSGQISDRNSDATCFVGSIDLKVTEDIIWELFTQVGPVGTSMMKCSVGFCRLSACKYSPCWREDLPSMM
jgi:hypothetical protein